MQRKLAFFLGIIFLLNFAACDNSTLEKPDTTSTDEHLINGVKDIIEIHGESITFNDPIFEYWLRNK